MYTPCPCFSCGKQIEHTIDLISLRDGSIRVLFQLDFAIEVTLQGSYGSRYDLTEMVIWICDDCIDKKMEERVFMINEDVSNDYTMENGNE
jgi:hypothetical protein